MNSLLLSNKNILKNKEGRIFPSVIGRSPSKKKMHSMSEKLMSASKKNNLNFMLSKISKDSSCYLVKGSSLILWLADWILVASKYRWPRFGSERSESTLVSERSDFSQTDTV